MNVDANAGSRNFMYRIPGACHVVKVLWYIYMRDKGSIPALLTNACISIC